MEIRMNNLTLDRTGRSLIVLGNGPVCGLLAGFHQFSL